jgi:hypothetical protein
MITNLSKSLPLRLSRSWSFRRQYLSYYRERDFESSWDYFLYLHINPHVQTAHAWGTFIGLLFFPWAFFAMIFEYRIAPMIFFTCIYYGTGFVSHFTGDGQISETWRKLMETYKFALRLNLMYFARRLRPELARFAAKYPHVLWVYYSEFEMPKQAEGWTRPTARTVPTPQ